MWIYTKIFFLKVNVLLEGKVLNDLSFVEGKS